jgi:hypothetical protein
MEEPLLIVFLATQDPTLTRPHQPATDVSKAASYAEDPRPVTDAGPNISSFHTVKEISRILVALKGVWSAQALKRRTVSRKEQKRPTKWRYTETILMWRSELSRGSCSHVLQECSIIQEPRLVNHVVVIAKFVSPTQTAPHATLAITQIPVYVHYAPR